MLQFYPQVLEITVQLQTCTFFLLTITWYNNPQKKKKKTPSCWPRHCTCYALQHTSTFIWTPLKFWHNVLMVQGFEIREVQITQVAVLMICLQQCLKHILCEHKGEEGDNNSHDSTRLGLLSLVNSLLLILGMNHEIST